MSRRHAVLGSVIVAFQVTAFACARAPARHVEQPTVRVTADAAAEEASVDAGDADWARKVCAERYGEDFVAEAESEVAVDCYPKPPHTCALLVPVRLASCAPFARDLVRGRETIDGVEQASSFEFPAMGVGPSGATLLVPATKLGVHRYTFVPKAEGHPDGWATLTVALRDPALERARKEYCSDLDGAGVFDAGAPPPARDGIELKVEHTRCYGSCPAYTVALRTDGTVIYEGFTDVRVKGVVFDLVPPPVVANLLARFDRALAKPPPVDDPHSHRTRAPADSPKTHVTLLRNGKIHRTADDGSSDEREIAAEIDRITRSDRWVTGGRACGERLW